MRVNECIACRDFPCQDVRHDAYILPDVEMEPGKIALVMIAEAVPSNPADYFYAGEQAQFSQTTLLAFKDAGLQVDTVDDLLMNGIYLTTAVKCGKTGYGIQTGTIKQCSFLLERELVLFTGVKVILCMGDVAIKAMNAIAARQGEARVIPAGSTYKIRGGDFYYRGCRVFPSYLQAGPSFFIEKSKRRMIAEDIAAALKIMAD